MSISIVLGPMMSGKSTELLRYLERAKRGNKSACLVRPETDDRTFFSHSSATELSYNNLKIPTYNFPTDAIHIDMIESLKNFDVIGFDEVQFMSAIQNIIKSIHSPTRQIYMSGLLATSECEMFPAIQSILPYCDYIHKLNAVCCVCGSDVANYTYYKAGEKTNNVEVGGNDKYDARCLNCYLTK